MMHLRPTSINIWAFQNHLKNKLTDICFLQSASYGYTDMIKQAEVYGLTGEEPWNNLPNPGNACSHTDSTLNTMQQQDAEVIYAGEKATYVSQINVQTAMINALNNTVREGYKR
eukprot:406580-Ditylum_brightwellii.AAC.1